MQLFLEKKMLHNYNELDFVGFWCQAEHHGRFLPLIDLQK